MEQVSGGSATVSWVGAVFVTYLVQYLVHRGGPCLGTGAKACRQHGGDGGGGEGSQRQKQWRLVIDSEGKLSEMDDSQVSRYQCL